MKPARKLLWICLLAGATASCGEPSLRVNFLIPDLYKQNASCRPNCDSYFQTCLQPNSNAADCQQRYDECLHRCQDNGQQGSNPECEKVCATNYQVCLKPVSEDECRAIQNTCYRSCDMGLMQVSSLRIYQPSQGSPFGCQEMSFGDIPQETLAASLIQEVTISSGETGDKPLAGIDRVGAKVLLAQAFDSGGEPVVVACQEVGEITDDLQIDLAGEPAVVVTLQGDFTAWSLNAQGLPPQVVLTTSDAVSRPLASVAARWVTVGPAGTGASGTAQSDGRGELNLNPTAPLLPGPAVLEIRARWQRNDTPLIKGFKRPSSASIVLPTAPILSMVAGKIGPAGESGFAALTTCASAPDKLCVNLRIFQLGGNWAGWEVGLDALATEGGLLGAIAEGTLDRVVWISGTRWLKLDTRTLSWQVCDFQPAGTTPVLAVRLPVCAAEEKPEVLWVAFQSGLVGVYGSSGGAPDASHPFAAITFSGSGWSAGCVGDQIGSAHRVLVGHPSGGSWEAYAQLGTALLSTSWQSPLSAVGFSAPVGQEPGTLLLGKLGAESPEVSRQRIFIPPGTPALAFEEIASTALFMTPELLGGGDMDGDQRPDLLALFTLKDPNGFQQYYAQSVLGITHGHTPVSGMMPLGSTIQQPMLWLADFDQDGLHQDWAVMRVLSPGSGGDNCQVTCDQEYKTCLSQGVPDCDLKYQDCMKNCQDHGPSQALDVYFMGR